MTLDFFSFYIKLYQNFNFRKTTLENFERKLDNYIDSNLFLGLIDDLIILE